MISSWLEQERLLRRLTDSQEDAELDKALDRLRKNFYQLYQPVREYQEHPERLKEWQKAEKPSPEWRKALFFEEGLRVLSVALFG